MEVANSFPQAVSTAHPPTHQDNVLRYWHQVVSLAIDNLHVLLAPKSQNRGSHSSLIPAPDWRYSRAWPRSGYAGHHDFSRSSLWASVVFPEQGSPTIKKSVAMLLTPKNIYKPPYNTFIGISAYNVVLLLFT